ncbi:MAG TPA: hypothetical protein PLT26_16605 [Anaerolineaceae bacterium]|nr:hypothetical protein [Anaerolineaceae bacterium]HQH87123.1 hypothetical protein [Anaerolineaceae bacterium]
MAEEKITRGNASQFFIAGELCRRGYSAVVTLGNTPNTDILCSNLAGNRFVHIQVKTYLSGGRTCSIGKKAEIYYGDNFFWVLGGIPTPTSTAAFEYYIIPSSVMSANTCHDHAAWLSRPAKDGNAHRDSKVRMVMVPPHHHPYYWDISEYKNRWDLIEEKLRG